MAHAGQKISLKTIGVALAWCFECTVQCCFIADITYGLLGMVIMIWVMVVKMIAALPLIVIKSIMVCDDGNDVENVRR